MKKALIVGMIVLAGWAAREGKGSDKKDLFVVAYHNYAGVPPEVLQMTQTDVAMIFDKAGIELEWVALPVPGHDTGPAVYWPSATPMCFLRLMPDSMLKPFRRSDDELGFASGPNVYIHAEHIQRLADRAKFSSAKLLGYIVAHEIGHVLLGGGGHSSAGIMRPKIGPAALLHLEWPVQSFSPAEARRLSDGLLRAWLSY